MIGRKKELKLGGEEENRIILRVFHPRPVVIVSCSSLDGRRNALTIAWSTPTSFNPPMVAVSISPKNYSYSIISESKEFAINVPSIEFLDDVYYLGSVSGREVNKLELRKIRVSKGKRINSPILEDCYANLECKVEKEIVTGDHTLFIGQVLAVYCSEDLFYEEVVDVKKYKPILHCGKNLFTIPISEFIKPSLSR